MTNKCQAMRCCSSHLYPVNTLPCWAVALTNLLLGQFVSFSMQRCFILNHGARNNIALVSCHRGTVSRKSIGIFCCVLSLVRHQLEAWIVDLWGWAPPRSLKPDIIITRPYSFAPLPSLVLGSNKRAIWISTTHLEWWCRSMLQSPRDCSMVPTLTWTSSQCKQWKYFPGINLVSTSHYCTVNSSLARDTFWILFN